MRSPALVSTVLLLAFALPCAQAALINAALNVYSGASQSSQLGTFTPGKALDGVTTGGQSDITHTNGTEVPFWQVDLGATVRIQDIQLFNRTDCCAGRLSDVFIEVLDHTGAVVGSSGQLNDGNTAFGGAANPNAGPATLAFTPTDALYGRTIRVRREDGATGPTPLTLSLSEVRVMADNIALGVTTTQTSGGPGGTTLTGAEVVDGNLGNFSHTLGTDENPTLTLDLGAVYALDSLILHNRDTCCGDRMSEITVALLGPGDSLIYTSPTLNPGNALVSPASMGLDLHQLTGGAVVGVSKIRITRDISAFQGTGNDVMSFGEVQAYGTLVPEPASAMLLVLGLGGLRLTLRRARA